MKMRKATTVSEVLAPLAKMQDGLAEVIARKRDQAAEARAESKRQLGIAQAADDEVVTAEQALDGLSRLAPRRSAG